MLINVVMMIVGYLLGSVPTGVVLGKKIKQIDIREHGSKNPGATNAYRVLGPKLGVTILILDILKGFIPVLIANKLGVQGFYLVGVGLIAILGHTFSPFLKFKGGKGVATSLGVLLYIAPISILLVLIFFVIIVYFSRFISLGSILGSISFPIFTYFVYGLERKEVVFFGIILAIYITYKHKSNIQRILKGDENKFNFKTR